ncbi:hypothetical protein FPSE_10291 [Fusarium pseudograminearum CS3096]|uniref:Delta(24)-sterol reductase n=1 Tax=Fusarium pseudograminearum (strain CS3096) TaxID=1028729 RepID=K3VXV9_FUSPC|nr:hypothetical protein FPSE_10291 [Fusarium pseudograminearum CS3096]EKJ69580.1 hypothetical protein FPSE_10291 [Fusarium pseudograminearum CS3096]
MQRHDKIVEDVSMRIRDLHKIGQPYRISHGSSSSTRPRHSPSTNVIDISMLSQVISVDTEKKTCLVEPNVPMDRLVEATMPYGLIPPVVMEFPGITAGGGYSGTSGESSSFRHGFFNETINFVEMILGNGDVVRASPEEREDLFYGAAGAAGTLGVTTLLEVRLVEARKFVKTTYHRVDSVSTAVSETQKCCGVPDTDYVDGILFSKDHGVVITGQLTDHKPPESHLVTFSNAADPWFYLHVQEKTKDLLPSSHVTEYIPLGEYLFRYDRAAFWVGRQGYTYFKFIPFNRFFRWLLDDYSHTRTLYHALHASCISEQFVVQDLALPYDTAEEFIDWVDSELGIWPLWLCPLKEARMPTFHPVTTSVEKHEVGDDEVDMSQPMLNIGVWGWGPRNAEEFKAKNRSLEKKLADLRGRKWLYAHAYYTEEKFWELYDRPWYRNLRERYFATTLPTVYDKVKQPEGPNGQTGGEGWSWKSLWNKWPIGGLYGMYMAFNSGDISLHRQTTWKYKSE